MARGGIAFDDLGFRGITFKAGAGIKALVAAANRNAVVGMPVVISGAGEVDLGAAGDTVYGFIEVYEDDGYCTIQVDGFRTDVPVSGVELDTATVGKIVATNGAGGVKDSAETAKLRTPVFVEVDATAKTATVFLG